MKRQAAEAVLDHFSFCDFFADKGFLGFNWQTQIFDQTNNLIWTPRRSNQYYQNAKNLDRWLSSLRERIEGVFHEVQNTGRNIERLIIKNRAGFMHSRHHENDQPSFATFATCRFQC